MSKPLIKVVSRGSALAVLQAQEIVEQFPEIRFQLQQLASLGDKQKKKSLWDDIPQDFFTRELDNEVLSGKVDIAIHSAKDLPYPLLEGLSIIALTKCLDPTDALVSLNKTRLNKLPPGAKIGTSSLARKEQLAAARPDLKVVSIRGTIEERLALLRAGKIEGLIVATAALKRLGLESEIAEILDFETQPLQGHLAIVAKSDRSDLKVLFSKIDIRCQFGQVYLVGAGVGELENITLKADKYCQSADVIFYDDLISKTLLARYSAKIIYVGKRKAKASFSQNEINEKLYEAARQGQRVVRLKGGDSLVFSRAGEEIKYLQERLIYVELIPGLSSAQVAATSINTPLTMRGVTNKLSYLTAHSLSEQIEETEVYFMGASKLAKIQSRLKQQKYPVVLVQDAGSVNEQIVRCSAGDLGRQSLSSPLIVISSKNIGRLVSNDKVLFTGLTPEHCRLNARLVPYPLIKVKKLGVEIKNLDQYDAVIFSSQNAVRMFFESHQLKPNQRIISIGDYTTEEIRRHGHDVDHQPERADSTALAQLLKKLKYQKILYPTSQLSANDVHKDPKIKVVVIYKTISLKPKKINLDNFSGVVFSSESTVNSFFKIYKKFPKHLVAYVYGSFTAASLLKRGVKNVQALSPRKG